MSDNEIISCEPATGAELWRGKVGDVDEIVLRARRAWPQWAAQPLATRIELMRRFANEVRKEQDAFAELIAKETGKPLWEARSEVESVVGKVEVSIRASSASPSVRSARAVPMPSPYSSSIGCAARGPSTMNVPVGRMLIAAATVRSGMNSCTHDARTNGAQTASCATAMRVLISAPRQVGSDEIVRD